MIADIDVDKWDYFRRDSLPLRAGTYNFNYERYSSQFIVPDWRDKVDSGIGLFGPACQPMYVYSLSGQYDNPMPELT